MSRSTLRFLAVVLTVLIAVVLFAGLDTLPRGVRAQMTATAPRSLRRKRSSGRRRMKLP